MTSPLNRDGAPPPSNPPSRPSPTASAPLVEAVRRHRRSHEIEDATLIEMAALLDELKRKYRRELDQRIEDRRLLQSSIHVAELHHSYLNHEVEVIGQHIGNLFLLHRQASRELRVFRRWIDRLYPGWSRVFDEASRHAAGDNSAGK